MHAGVWCEAEESKREGCRGTGWGGRLGGKKEGVGKGWGEGGRQGEGEGLKGLKECK